MATERPLPVVISRLAAGVFPSLALLAAVPLDLFSALHERGSGTSGEIAAQLGLSADKLGPLLYALAATGLLTMEGERFVNTPEAETYLVRGSPTYLGNVTELWGDLWQAAFRTAETVRTGTPQAKHDFATMPEHALASFIEAHHPLALASGRDLARRFDLTARRGLIDVGGGSGGLSIGLCESLPELHATVLDLPSVVPLAERAARRSPWSDRITVRAQDILAGPPEGRFDIAVLRAFIQVLSRDAAQRAIAHVAGALLPGADIFIIGWILDDSRLAPPEAVGFNLAMINAYSGGQAYTEAEHRSWLEAAGFQCISRTQLVNGTSIVHARMS